jgi:hypothetical protein
MSASERLIRALAIFGLLSTLTSVAKADGVESENRTEGRPADVAAAAQSLFVEGKRLVSEGRFAEACASFEQSQHLDPAAGTEINLADCYEKSGRIATAWITFHEAVGAADRARRPDWAEQARQRARILEGEVPQLTLMVDAPPPGFELWRDRASVGPSTYGIAVPVDPGTHEITATAPSHGAWSTRVTIEKGAHVILYVPSLAEQIPASIAAHDAPASSFRPAEARARGSAAPIQRTIAFTLGGAAIVLMGVGTYAGLTAIADNADAAQRCPASPRCTDPRAVGLTDDARHAASVSTVAFIAGGAVLVSSAVVLFTARSARSASSIAVGLTGGNVFLSGRW